MNRRIRLAQQATGIVMACVWLVSVLVLADGRVGAAEPVRLIALQKIWDQAPHNAFTDLIRYQDRWFCTFREGEGHASFDGRLRVLYSADGAKWDVPARFRDRLRAGLRKGSKIAGKAWTSSARASTWPTHDQQRQEDFTTGRLRTGIYLPVAAVRTRDANDRLRRHGPRVCDHRKLGRLCDESVY